MTSILEAARAVRARQRDYGSPDESFAQIATLWSAYLTRHIRMAYPDATDISVELNNPDVANLMILLKVSRAQNSNDADSYVDIAGYAQCVELMGCLDGGTIH